MKIHHTHIKRIKQLFRQRFNLIELHLMYKGKIDLSRLREITATVKQDDRI